MFINSLFWSTINLSAALVSLWIVNSGIALSPDETENKVSCGQSEYGSQE